MAGISAGKEQPQKSLWTGIDSPSKADGGSVIDPADIAAKELADLQGNWKDSESNQKHLH